MIQWAIMTELKSTGHCALRHFWDQSLHILTLSLVSLWVLAGIFNWWWSTGIFSDVNIEAERRGSRSVVSECGTINSWPGDNTYIVLQPQSSSQRVYIVFCLMKLLCKHKYPLDVRDSEVADTAPAHLCHKEPKAPYLGLWDDISCLSPIIDTFCAWEPLIMP